MSKLSTKFFRAIAIISAALFLYISASSEAFADAEFKFDIPANAVAIDSDNRAASIFIGCWPRVSMQPVVFFVARDPLLLGLQRVSILDSWGRAGPNKFVASQRLAGLLIRLIVRGQGNFMYLSPAIHNPQLDLQASLTFRATAAHKRDIVLLWGVCSG